jgi:membrane protease YdiL (CAAX protease family)
MNYLAQASKSAPALIILSILMIGCVFSAPEVFSSQFGRVYDARQPFTLCFMVIYSSLFLLAAPLFLGKYISKQSLRELGLCFPENKKVALLLSLSALLILIPAVCFSASHKIVQTFYSLKNLSAFEFILILLFALPPYYLAEEFFFRGFLFMGLWRKIGWHSYWITEVIFTWAHLGKPPIEILIAFPAGIILNYLTLRTRSIYPAMFVHYTMGAVMNGVVTFYY